MLCHIWTWLCLLNYLLCATANRRLELMYVLLLLLMMMMMMMMSWFTLPRAAASLNIFPRSFVAMALAFANVVQAVVIHSS